MATESFTHVNFKPETLAVIANANKLLAEESGITMRGLYYQFIGQDLFPDSWADEKTGSKNTIRNYKHLIDIMGKARLAGMVDWDDIVDELREATVWRDYKNIKEPIEEAIHGFRLERWKGQPNYVELWVEKNTLAQLAEPIASKYHVPLMVNRGYSSLSAMYVCAQRLLQRGRNHEQTIIIYCGDHDPSGEDMVRDVKDRLVTFGVENLEVRKACLTMEQVRRHKLPPNPARPPPEKGKSKKGTDSRAIGYIEEHGLGSWEVEALKPAQIRQYIEAPFKTAALIDKAIMQPILDREETQREKLQESIDKMLEELGETDDE